MKYMKQDAEICNKAYLYFENNEPLPTNKVCNTITNVGIKEFNSNFSIYPNPVSSKLHITSKSKTNYIIYSLVGIEMLKGEIESTENTVDIEHLVPGIYIIKLNGIGSQRFVISK
jgi:hypothetical protein